MPDSQSEPGPGCHGEPATVPGPAREIPAPDDTKQGGRAPYQAPPGPLSRAFSFKALCTPQCRWISEST
eukprot:332896-Hanusia_phi.AAC.1